MRYFKIYLLLILLSVFRQNSFSQSDEKGYTKRLADIFALKDVNEQKYQLALFDKDFNAWLKQNDINDNVTWPLKTVMSNDKKFTIIYYTQNDQVRGGIRYTLFVRYSDEKEKVKVHTFKQEVFPDVRSSEKMKDPVIRMASRVLEGKKLYELSFSASGDPLVWLKYSDLKLKCLFEEINNTKDDERKAEINREVLERLRLLWNSPEYFGSEFPGLMRMKTIFSDDNKLKICTYGIGFTDFSNVFYGAVLLKDSKKIKVFDLTDRTKTIRSPSRVTLPDNKWYGAMYLDIIEKHYQKKTYYTLLGYKGQDEFVKTRVVDVLWFAGNKPRFGAPIFKNDRLTFNRLIFKYSLGANMVLRYDAKKKMIVMDNLEPSDAMYKGVYRFYGPDFTYNGYKFEKGKWVIYKNIDMRNPE